MPNFRTSGFIARPRNPMYTVGKKLRTVHARAALVSANMANGDTVELGGPFTFNERIHRILSPNATPALTSAAGVKLGFFYKDKDGNLVLIKSGSDALLWNGISLAASVSARDLLTNFNGSLNQALSIGDLLQLSQEQEPSGGTYLALTFPTKPSVDGVLDLDVVVEEATVK